MALARIDAMLDRRDRRHRFQRRSGRIEAARRLVDQRLVIVGAQPRIFAGADAVGKAVRVEARHRHEGEDVTVVTVDDDRRARFAPHAPRDIFLQAGVDRQMDGLALRSEEHTSELQSLMRISYAVYCLTKKTSLQTLQHI